MTTNTPTQYQHLEPRPGSNYRQLFLKGRRIWAAVVDEAIHGPDPRTPEEFARDYEVPLEAVLEALDYVAQNRLLIELERDREAAKLRPGASTGPRRDEAPARREHQRPTPGRTAPGSGARSRLGHWRRVAVCHRRQSVYRGDHPGPTRVDPGF